MVWYSHLLKNFPQFVVIHTVKAVKGFSIVNEAEVGIFVKFPCFLCDPVDVGNLISGSSAFSKTILNKIKSPAKKKKKKIKKNKTILNTWKFTVYVLLKPGLENFEHYFTSV